MPATTATPKNQAIKAKTTEKTAPKGATVKTVPAKSQASKPASQIPAKPENRLRGAMFALLAPLVGSVLWVILWRWGFIASLVAYLITFLTIKLYIKGAGTLSRKSLPIVLGIAVGGVALAFVCGVASDALAFYAEQAHVGQWAALSYADFWSFLQSNLIRGEIWSSYTNDLLIAVAFAALGMYGTVKELLLNTAAPVKQASTKPAKG
jgi:hypothetical protein